MISKSVCRVGAWPGTGSLCKRWMLQSLRSHHMTLVTQSSVQPTKEQTSQTQEETKVVNPLEHDDFFGVRPLVTVRELFDARVHLGHKQGVRNPYMQPYIFGNRLGVDIIDLQQTKPLLQDSLNFLAHVAFREGVILFLSRHQQTLLQVDQLAADCGEYTHSRHWKKGTFTNATMMYAAVTRLPDICVFLSTHDTVFEQHLAVVEAAKMNIPTIGILDTSCDPRLITYPVPGNDDTPDSIQLYCRLFKEAVMRGKAKRDELQTDN